jgi:hypothetical protein
VASAASLTAYLLFGSLSGYHDQGEQRKKQAHPKSRK